jgi:hypothetical protein
MELMVEIPDESYAPDLAASRSAAQTAPKARPGALWE